MLAGQHRDWYLYYLVDGIYPEWAINVKPDNVPFNTREQAMTKSHEGHPKDFERLFGVL